MPPKRLSLPARSRLFSQGQVEDLENLLAQEDLKPFDEKEVERFRKLLHRANLAGRWPDKLLDFLIVTGFGVGTYFIYDGAAVNAEHSEEHILHHMFGEDLTALADTFAYPYMFALMAFAIRSIRRRIKEIIGAFQGGNPEETCGFYILRTLLFFAALLSGGVGAVNNIEAKKQLILIILAYLIAVNNNDNVASKAKNARKAIHKENALILEWQKRDLITQFTDIRTDLIKTQAQLLRSMLPIILKQGSKRAEIDDVYKIFELAYTAQNNWHTYPRAVRDFLNSLEDKEPNSVLNIMACAAYFSDAVEKVELMNETLFYINFASQFLGIACQYLVIGAMGISRMLPKALAIVLAAISTGVNQGILIAEQDPTRIQWQWNGWQAAIKGLLVNLPSIHTSLSVGVSVGAIVYMNSLGIPGGWAWGGPAAALAGGGNIQVYKASTKVLFEKIAHIGVGLAFPGIPTLKNPGDSPDAMQKYCESRWMKSSCQWVATKNLRGTLEELATLAANFPDSDRFNRVFLQIYLAVLRDFHRLQNLGAEGTSRMLETYNGTPTLPSPARRASARISSLFPGTSTPLNTQGKQAAKKSASNESQEDDSSQVELLTPMRRPHRSNQY